MAPELYHQNEDGVVVYHTEDNTLQFIIGKMKSPILQNERCTFTN